MGEPTSARIRIVEGLIIGAGGSLLTFIGALIWPPMQAWLLDDVTLPGWTIVAAGILVIAGIAVGVSKPRRNSIAAPSPPRSAAKFTPSDLQIKCVAALRFFDDEWVRFDDLAETLEGEARADLRQALEGLAKVGWATDRLGYLDGASYRLDGGGLDFARLHNFPVRRKPKPYG